MVLADFADYQKAQKRVRETFVDKQKWNRMSLMNIALSGRFAADRAINEYAKDIWNTQKMI
jgi:starch phosphorylase